MSILLNLPSGISKMHPKTSTQSSMRAEMFIILMHMVQGAGLMRKRKSGWMTLKGTQHIVVGFDEKYKIYI